MIIQLEQELHGDNDDSYCLNLIAHEMRALSVGVKGQIGVIIHTCPFYNLVDPNMKGI